MNPNETIYSGLAYCCKNLTSVDLDSFVTLGNELYMTFSFSGLKEINFGNLVSATTFSYLANGCSDLSAFKAPNLSAMNYFYLTFNYCEQLKEIDLSSLEYVYP